MTELQAYKSVEPDKSLLKLGRTVSVFSSRVEPLSPASRYSLEPYLQDYYVKPYPVNLVSLLLPRASTSQRHQAYSFRRIQAHGASLVVLLLTLIVSFFVIIIKQANIATLSAL